MDALPLQVLVVEPEIILRNALLAFLEVLDDIQPVGEAVDAAEALELCQIMHPDVILMDINLPDMDGIELIRQLRACCIESAIVVLTSATNSDLMRDALLAGATGWLENWMGVDQVVAALRLASLKTAYRQT